jgi:hypothetical protein
VNGLKFFQWFVKNKGRKMVNNVIAPVRQRAGLGCPPSTFTTNRSERTNGVIQDFIKRRYGLRRVDVFSFSVALQDLIDMQEKEFELAVVGKGEYRICPAYQDLQVTPTQWTRMTQKQQKQALLKIRTTSVEDTSSSSQQQVTRALSEEIDPILGEVLQAGVDWLPCNVLAEITKKAAEICDAGTTVELPVTGTTTTVIVPSRRNPQQPHIVNVYPNGKCECDKSCPGFSVENICAHVLVACLKMSRLKDFLHWFVTTKRRTGGVNYTRAVSFGMPAGRGRKGEAPPRKRKKRSPATTQVPRNETQQFSAPPVQAQQLPTFQTQTHGNPIQQNFLQPVNPPPQSPSAPYLPRHPPQPVRPSCPCPAPNSFILYSLHFCPPLTSVCFGCGNSLKPSGIICNPPGDLVIVSFMQRQYFYEGESRTRSGNVYFHCSARCVRLRQPAFDPLRHCVVTDPIRSLLTPVHYQYIEQNLGLRL